MRFVLKLTAFVLVWSVLQTTIDLSHAYYVFQRLQTQPTMPRTADLLAIDVQLHQCGPLTRWLARDTFGYRWSEAAAETGNLCEEPCPLTDDLIAEAGVQPSAEDEQAADHPPLAYPFGLRDPVLRCDATLRPQVIASALATRR